ncbi:saxiphilin isoform X3 [Microcaecilia unicolor]|uniref:Saxiphilin-like isoform X3 n=1 Tax=Microcaecilia unicolor TaxID=1415580 RepID=A0A6P7ZCX6_9AMPH|nr:saxiphilin-like isoform X3 [Microcaecilia unicolor]
MLLAPASSRKRKFVKMDSRRKAGMGFLTSLLLLTFLPLHSSGKKVRWCTLSEMEQRKCSDLSRALLAILPPAVLNSFARVSCVRTHSTQDCISKIQANKADIVSLDAGDVYTAVKLYNLAVVAKEISEEGSCVLAVAVTRRGSLDIQRLKGVRSCHNGAKWTSGWNIPVGFLLSKNYIHWDEEQSLIRALSEYFNASCIPGVGVAAPQLCALCQGQKSYIRDKNYFCESSHNEPFSDSEGAFRCLTSGVGDVAFLDHITIANATDTEQAEYELLCPDGSTANLTAYSNCNLGRGPGKAVISRHSFHKIAKKFLTIIQNLFGQKGKARTRFNLFMSAAFRGQNLLLRDTTQSLQLVEEQSDITEILGRDYVALLKGLGHEGKNSRSSLDNSILRWCCISAAELRKCEEWALNIQSDPLVCVRGFSQSSCIEMIKRNEADVVSLDATHVYIAGFCGLVPVAAEYWGKECLLDSGRAVGVEKLIHVSEKGLPPVYSVAVTKKLAKHVNIHNLGGRRSCHSHLYSPAGWLLLSKHVLGDLGIDNSSCDINSVYQHYFWKGCMPGAEGNLCKVCLGKEETAGKDNSRCVANHDERYYGNLGALRCLVGDPDGKSLGDVAFMEHYSLLHNIKNLERLGWATGYSDSDFELLCPDGSRAPVTDWLNCNLGPIPSNVVMTRPVITSRIHDFLVKSQETLDLKPDSKFQLFESYVDGEADLLFKDVTSCLVHTNHLSYRTLLGEQFYQLAESVFNCTHAGILEFCNQDVCTSSEK